MLTFLQAANWFFNWLLSFITPYLTGALNPTQSNVFWIWGSFCWLAVVFVYFMIYETKDLSLEQVNELYENEPRAWKSPQYKAALRRFSVTGSEGNDAYVVRDRKEKNDDSEAEQFDKV